MIRVVLRSLVGMVRGVDAVSMREMRVVPRFVVVVRVIVFGGLSMVMGGFFMMLCRRVMVIGAVMLLCAHVVLPDEVWFQ